MEYINELRFIMNMKQLSMKSFISSLFCSRGGLMGRALVLSLLLFGCSNQENNAPVGDDTTIRFTFPDIDVNTRTEETSLGLLAEGTTVRVVVCNYKGSYVKENSYIVQANGSLEPAVKELYLAPGQYRFYTITPDLAVQHSGLQPTVSVNHKTDFASSWTDCKVGTEAQKEVTLTMLDRKCSHIVFKADMSESSLSVAPVIIRQIALTAMTDQPQTFVGTGLFAGLATNSYTLIAEETYFKTEGADPRKATGDFVTLPKAKKTFDVKLSVSMGGNTKPMLFDASISKAIAFEPSLEYTFTIRLAENGTVGLWLTIASWIDHAQNPELGGNPSVTVQLGEWTDVNWGDVSMGQNPEVITKIDGWVELDWQAELGKNPVIDANGDVWNPFEWSSVLGQ